MTNWFITGISRGLGRALATAALARGDTVVGTARSGSFSLDHEFGTLHVLAADLGVQGSAEASVTKAFELVGAVDVIVNNAGFGLLGAVENATDQEVQALFAVDFFAPLRIIQTALPHLRKQGSGHIINITSIAGRAPTTGTAIYAAAKSALEALSMGLALEVAPLGIKVTAVAPGAFRTEFLSPNSVLRSAAADTVYSETIGRSAAAFETADGHQVGDPQLAAKAIIALADSANAPLHLLLGSDALTRARAKLGRVIEEMDAWEPVTRSTDFRDEPGTSDNAGGENEEARSPLVSNFIEAARSVFSSARMDDPTGSVLGDVFQTISSGRRPISRAVREMFPVCALVEPLLDELERTDERLRNVAKALRPLLPHIGWKRRQTGKNASDNFMDGHATGMIIGPGGAEDREDVWIGMTIMGPNVRYPDHSHPPEEVYLALSNGAFRQGENEWFDPGIGGVFHNPPGIVHGMRSGDAPMLALWFLPILPAPTWN